MEYFVEYFSVRYRALNRINEMPSCLKINATGEAELTSQQKDLFVLLGERLPEQDSIISVINTVNKFTMEQEISRSWNVLHTDPDRTV